MKPWPPARRRTFVGRPIELLCAAGMDRSTAVGAADVHTSYVNGFSIEEQARHLKVFSKAQRDQSFEFGVTVVINGLRTL